MHFQPSPLPTPLRAAYQQLQLLRIADHLNVGQRFRRTVKLGTLVRAVGNQNKHRLTLWWNETSYNVAYLYEVGQDPCT